MKTETLIRKEIKDLKIEIKNNEKLSKQLIREGEYSKVNENVEDLKSLIAKENELREELRLVNPEAPEFENKKKELFEVQKADRMIGSYKDVLARLKEFGFTQRATDNRDGRGFGVVGFVNPITKQAVDVHHTYDCFVSNDYWYIQIETFY